MTPLPFSCPSDDSIFRTMKLEDGSTFSYRSKMRISLILCMLTVCLLAYVTAKKGGRGGRSAASGNTRMGFASRRTVQKSSSHRSKAHLESVGKNPNINVNSIDTKYFRRNDIRKKDVRNGNTEKKSMDPKRSRNQKKRFENTHSVVNPQKSKNGFVHFRSMSNTANGVLSKRSKRSLPTLNFDCSSMPTICNNIRDTIDSGKPQYLSRSRSRISKNRYAACGAAGAGSGMSCDEFPFASTKQGGKGARLAYVPIEENRSQGGQLSAFYRKYGIKSYGPKSHFKVARPE